MKSKEAALKNFFANIEVAVREAGDAMDAEAKWGVSAGHLMLRWLRQSQHACWRWRWGCWCAWRLSSGQAQRGYGATG
jgi:hypothetical protein